MNKSLRIVSVMAVVLAVWLIAAPSEAQDDGKIIIRVKGAKTMATLIDKLAHSYAQVHPECSVVVSGGGMHEGFEALYDKTADAAMASRQMNEQEKLLARQKGAKLVEQLVGRDAIVIVAHPANPVNELTVEQVKKVFTGEYTDWNEVGGEILPIVLYVGDAARSGMAEYFNESILKGVPPYVNPRRYYPSIIKDVSSRADAAGYVPLALAQRAQGQRIIKVLAIKKDANSPAILPSHETVADSSYPLLRPLFLYYHGDSREKHVKQFVEFCAEKGMSVR